MISLEEMEDRHFINLASNLFAKNVLVLDIPGTLTIFQKLFARTEGMLDEIPDDIKPLWFEFMLSLLPVIEKLAREIEADYLKTKSVLAEKHPQRASLVAMLEGPDYLMASSWSKEDRKFLYGWSRNFGKKMDRRFKRILYPALETAFPILQFHDIDERQNAYDCMMSGRVVTNYCKEVIVSWMSFPTVARDHFFDMLRRSFGYFDHQMFMETSHFGREDA